ncbi:MAG: FAD:protein FMN transferase [Gemmatimonadota bacterium]
MRRREFLAAGVGLVAFPRFRPSRELRLIERWSWAMGQPVHLRLFHESEMAGYEAAQAVFAELRRIEARLSVFEESSDLAELNRQAGRGWFKADADLLAVLEAADRFRRVSGGGFNVAVEPLMRVWGFREWRQAVPGEKELAEAGAAVRNAVIELRGDRVRLPAAHTRLDFGGIAVGYGLDRAGRLLRERGVSAALLDVSGDLLAIGSPPGAPAWPIDIVDPRAPGAVLSTALLRDQALATSANTVSVVRLGARLIGHVMDPHLGVPEERRIQATVWARTGLEADALSTAVLVAGTALPGTLQHWTVGRETPPHRGGGEGAD